VVCGRCRFSKGASIVCSNVRMVCGNVRHNAINESVVELDWVFYF